MSSILTFENVSKNYGKLNALSNIQFEIPENSIFAILGPNGSGKSTLIRILAGLITSWNGNIFYKDHSNRKLQTAHHPTEPEDVIQVESQEQPGESSIPVYCQIF